MSDVAASGGYYIAMPAHTIVAEPATLTGSIGVVMMKFVIDGTLKKLGMNMEGGEAAGATPTSIPRCGRSRRKSARKIQEQMQATYDTFVEKAAAGRHTTPEKIDAIAQGRVWTGLQAKQIGLVDELGGLERALVLAKAARQDRAGTAKSSWWCIRRGGRSTTSIANPFGASDRSALLSAFLGLNERRALTTLTAPLRVFRRGEPLAIMPNVFVR